MQKGSMSPEFREPHRHGDPVVADERGVVWIAPPHDHDASVPSPRPGRQPGSGPVGSRVKSATFGDGWLSRQVGQVRGLLVRAPIRFLERARPVPDIGAARSSWASSPASVHCRATAASMNWAFSGWLMWLCPPGGGLVVYQAVPGSRFGERLDGQLATSRLVGGGENLPGHTGVRAAGPPVALRLVWPPGTDRTPWRTYSCGGRQVTWRCGARARSRR
jgi:hypothetical protein